MVYRNPDRRESQSQKGKDYVDAVIDFMSAYGFLTEGRAEDTGEGEDIVFKPKAGNRQPVIAEAKSRDVDSEGFSPNDYIKGFAERFMECEEGNYVGYEFHLFFEVESNGTLWRNLFHKHDSDEIEKFYRKMVSKTEGEVHNFLKKHDYSRFEQFAADSVIWASFDRQDLTRLVRRIEQEGDYDWNPYLETYDYVHESGSLMANLIEISSMPNVLYKLSAKEGLNTRAFYNTEKNLNTPVEYDSGIIYSLLHPDELPDVTLQFCDSTEPDEQNFSEWALTDERERVDIAKSLLKRLLVAYGLQNSAEVTRKRNDTRLYAVHGETDLSSTEGWLTQQLDSHPEVRHRTVALEVEFLTGKYYYALLPRQEFTKNGQTPVSGSRKEDLSADFNPAKYPQNDRKRRTVEMWADILSPNVSFARFQLPDPFKEIELRQPKKFQLEEARPPIDSAERKELIEGAVAPEQSQLPIDNE